MMADMVADIEVHMVTDMEGEKVADMVADMFADIVAKKGIQFGKKKKKRESNLVRGACKKKKKGTQFGEGVGHVG